MYEKQSRNTNRSTDTIASFLLKTYQILQHPQYQRMISWDKSNVGFIIHDVVSFTREILPKYFRHSNFSSFVRQLNMYDFHKVKQQNDSLVFKNPLFCKGQQNKLKFIRRKAAKKIGGQRRQQINQKNDLQNQKYQNVSINNLLDFNKLLKGFKKSIQSEINQSSLFYQRSIQLIKDLNESNIKKLNYIQKLYVNDQKSQTAQEIMKGNQTNSQQNGRPNIQINPQNPKKETVIRIPRQFIQPEQRKGIQQNLQSSPKKIVKTSPPQTRQISSIKLSQENNLSKSLNVDNMIILKQQIYKSLGTFERWLNDYIQIQKKKIKYVNSYKNQLIKCKEVIKENYYDNTANKNENGEEQEAQNRNQQSPNSRDIRQKQRDENYSHVDESGNIDGPQSIENRVEYPTSNKKESVVINNQNPNLSNIRLFSFMPQSISKLSQKHQSNKQQNKITGGPNKQGIFSTFKSFQAIPEIKNSQRKKSQQNNGSSFLSPFVTFSLANPIIKNGPSQPLQFTSFLVPKRRESQNQSQSNEQNEQMSHHDQMSQSNQIKKINAGQQSSENQN